MAKTPEQQFRELAETAGPVEEAAIAAVYDKLRPVDAEFMVSQWEGGSFDTGHPTHQTLRDFKWAGKDFRSVDDVDPIMFYDAEGKRTWLSKYGHARLREVKFRGVVTAAMVYDNFPIIDAFRFVDENTIVGAMDNKELQDAGTYYFYLKRRPGSRA
ncbi:hypothetical protein C8034_v004752 [Colletotrichum sidae]|uniref:DUF4334 domain-containing protein n=1 Tax=Colletotrichum sidae TaxID=1347389 RepID=A0A4R8T728_9PEZI|nr:hypothetical protein C8034_v004752 [Colletotrichum sidae]